MWLLTTWLLWAPVGGQVVNATKAEITLRPPWLSIFLKENVTLSCKAPHLPGNSSTQWFINDTAILVSTPTYSIQGASFKDSGEYKCQIGPSMPSDPVQLEIHNAWVILQVSRRVLAEGEPLFLKCHGWKTKVMSKVVFFRNGKTLRYVQQSELDITRTTLNDNGIYYCLGTGRRHRYKSADVSITVKELFATPVLRVSLPSPYPEGSQVNLTCETTLFLPSPGLQLYFSFYMGSEILEEKTIASEYHIPSMQRKDSGLYSCEVFTEGKTVLKRSPELRLRVLGAHSSAPVWFHILFYLSVGVLFL
ncbi:high affinity immunoglobulin gamma Fc receptor I [Arvicanthis niloticus]|uniref:high affinity immunoglobulin gamma Fc receptor I n=1 Tax=Arvicanthis niloticus TaxID=61156 RepID=UPI00402B5FF7